MGKVKSSFFRAAEPSATVEYAMPNRTFPTAALMDYVVHRGAKPQKVSFITSDSYKPDYIEGSGNYLSAPADDCIDFRAANYILQRRLSLEYDSD